MILPTTHIIILGVEGSGKKILARKLAKHYGIKLLPRLSSEKLMFDEIKQNARESWILLDFPKNREQAEKLSKIAKIHRVIYLDIPMEVSVARQKTLMAHPKSGRVYFEDGFFPSDEGHDLLASDPLVKVNVGRKRDIIRKYLEDGVSVSPVLDYYASKKQLQMYKNRDFDQLWTNVANFIDRRGKEYAVKSLVTEKPIDTWGQNQVSDRRTMIIAVKDNDKYVEKPMKVRSLAELIANRLFAKDRSSIPIATKPDPKDIGLDLKVEDSDSKVTRSEGTREHSDLKVTKAARKVKSSDSKVRRTRPTFDDISRHLIQESLFKSGMLVKSDGFPMDPNMDSYEAEF